MRRSSQTARGKKKKVQRFGDKRWGGGGDSQIIGKKNKWKLKCVNIGTVREKSRNGTGRGKYSRPGSTEADVVQG